MRQYISQFQDILENRGILAALSATFFYFERTMEKKIGLDNYIMSRFAIGGPPSILHALYVKIYTPRLERKVGSGIEVMEQEWDTLILLDSYRADFFQEYSSLDGDYSTVASKANISAEFVAKNFQGEYHDTVVVSANPWYQKRSNIDKSTFHALINPIQANENYKSNPQRVTQAALEAHKEHPNKRLIVHYMQPHTPHMGETSDRLRKKYRDVGYPGIFTLYRRGLISQDELEQSYVETIRVVESTLQELLNALDGKTVVSSDHGENLGECQHGMMQLRHGNPTPECRYVPWLELDDNNNHREITEDPPEEFRTPNNGVVEDRLEALGYK